MAASGPSGANNPRVQGSSHTLVVADVVANTGPENAEPGSTYVSRARKKPRVGNKGKNVIRGQEKEKSGDLVKVYFHELPLDVLYEVLLHAGPGDLMQLSRTNKFLRSVLVSISMRFIWKNAIEATSMPPCPSDLNEMEYVKFVLDNFCDYCNRNRRGEFYHIYLTRKKVCNPCLNNSFMGVKKNPLRRLLPCVFIPPGTGQYYSRGGTYRACKEEHRAVKAEYESKMENGGWVAWYAERLQKVEKHGELRPLLEAWFEAEKNRQKEEEESFRRARYNAVLTKLKEEGWAEEVEWMEDDGSSQEIRDLQQRLQYMQQIWLPQPLTTQAWTKMKAEVLEIMRVVREKLQSARRAQKLSIRFPLLRASILKWSKHHAHDHFGANVEDIAEQDEVSALVLAPLDTDVTEEDFDNLLEYDFPRFSALWRSQYEDQLLDLIRFDLRSADISLLADLGTVFRCKRCKACVQYPWMLKHGCSFPARSHDEPQDIARIVSNFQYDSHISRKARNVLSSLKKPPSRNLMTLELFECAECSENARRRVLITWKEAISGQACVYLGHSISQAILTPSEETLKNLYIDLQMSILEKEHGLPGSKSPIECAICAGFMPEVTATFEQHQRVIHNKPSQPWREGVDFYRRPNIVETMKFRSLVLKQDANVRDIIYQVLVNPSRSDPLYFLLASGKPGLGSDFRSDPLFAEGNYSFQVGEGV